MLVFRKLQIEPAKAIVKVPDSLFFRDAAIALEPLELCTRRDRDSRG
jgi:hypothetical protein